MKLLIVGCGYVGCEVRRRVPAGWSVTALTRSQERHPELRHQGIEPLVGDWLVAHGLPKFQQVDKVLVSVPHRPHPDLAEQSHAVGLRHLTESLPPGWNKLVYVSTTGVYGDRRDDRVDESTPVSPTRSGPAVAVAGEQWLRDHLPTHKLVILRLAGIYGPGRLPLADKLKRGEPLPVPQDGFLNLAHVTDIAHVIVQVLGREMRHNLYLFSDGRPVPRLEFYRYLAELCGAAQPEFIEPAPGDARSRRATSKRVDPSRLVRELQFEYQYPDYRTGLVNSLR